MILITKPKLVMKGPHRMIWGGCWNNFCRSAYRYGDELMFRSYDLGFRIVLRRRHYACDLGFRVIVRAKPVKVKRRRRAK